jgi:hypothetical protein
MYQRDIHFLSDTQNILEHSPVLHPEQRYEAAYKEIQTMLEGTGEAVDDEFWPVPNRPRVMLVTHDGDSDDHLDTGTSHQCNCG